MLNGDEIRQRREALNISQRKLAQKVGLSQQSLSRMENNLSEGTTSIGRIAAALGCKVTDLDPEFGTGTEMTAGAASLSDDAAALLAMIASRIEAQVGFRPTDVQVIHHLLARSPHRDLIGS
jgi:Predicted transcriptional regulator with C-terminal CBS domains